MKETTSSSVMTDGQRPLLELRGIAASYRLTRGLIVPRTVGHVRAIDEVDLRIFSGESLGLVGESGCGKSSLARVILGLVRPTGGQILLDGADITTLSRAARRDLRRRVQLVFQDPFDSLDPLMSVGDIVAEGLVIQRLGTRRARAARVQELLQQVHLPAALADRRPRELSGGQRQRVAIARALAVDPDILVLDEPVSALDVSVQAQVLNLLNELRELQGLTYLFISHDLSVVRQVCARTAVMYLGRIVEVGETGQVIDRPLHPYTRALVDAVPLPDPVVEQSRSHRLLAGELPSPSQPPNGCSLHPRCPLARPMCAEIDPRLEEKRASQFVACHVVDQQPTLSLSQ